MGVSPVVAGGAHVRTIVTPLSESQLDTFAQPTGSRAFHAVMADSDTTTHGRLLRHTRSTNPARSVFVPSSARSSAGGTDRLSATSLACFPCGASTRLATQQGMSQTANAMLRRPKEGGSRPRSVGSSHPRSEYLARMIRPSRVDQAPAGDHDRIWRTVAACPIPTATCDSSPDEPASSRSHEAPASRTECPVR